MQSVHMLYNNTEFWSDKFWLPPNETWQNVHAPNATDFSYCVLVAAILYILRAFLYNYVYTPLGLYCGLRLRKVKRVPNIPLLVNFYQIKKRPSPDEIRALSKKLDVSTTKVSNWFRSKRNSTKFPVIVKFVESGWKFSFYFCLFSYGIFCLYQEPFLYDTSEFFRTYPHHEISRCIFWYYMIELAYYVSGLILVFLEVKRKDFFVMLTHHVVTVTLISISYLTNYFRIGSIIMLLHDSCDFWLEAAKMFKYVGKYWSCMVCFMTFICVWSITRLYYFPFRVISSVLFEAPQLIGFYPALDVFATFLIALQILHIFWTVQIIRTAVKPFTTGQLSSDARSDSEMSESESECVNGGCVNGTIKVKE